ncbi:3-methyladenine DNA glycosylase [Mycobacterium sp. CBMA293]|nr:3-methyladenine DNA glycosylase [Mycolicibacterium sp. CBMA 360]MUL62137.1 3-methyladenine DNA glycosylase [Mycolicibacterium sp. CBMA 335]MUL71598.1 3-methyladenine DNA glycosylase [Mycolicibacterium sp. CBMA 311]MUL93553.1 3-methyladenine DNA glycosylase [Mycolicibacterium sp. CBMA 230]MUM09380.1 3-methyladenine DNA glycosylase [Mycolicibacterium sp. CBMA 213]MUM10439.1 3-methyladenine DNA glycosylase [Mycolicibacterium sp. CBMA 293]
MMVRTVSDTATLVVLAEDDWATREQRYLERVEAFLAPHEARMRAGRPHPVWDFLFTYYSLKPRQLRRWHPGFGVALAGAGALRFADRAGYGRHGDAVTVTAEHQAARRDTVAFVADLLAATASRPARLNCFGLHEWAMVYRAPEVRHDQVPLRLGASGTDAVVESMPLRCSHFDAYRFFTDAAVPRNSETLTRHAQSATEQPGCVHANMDLYKWSYKLGPLLESNLLMDCLDLAADARVLDMQASPYDLRAYGIEPIAIEDSTGRAEYARRQQDIANRAVPLRHSMLNQCQYLLALADGGDMS